MTGRGRGRPATRQQQPAEGTTVAVRRATRLQQQSPPPPQGEQVEQQQLQQHPVQDAQIDPTLTGAQESEMPPPPIPAPKGQSEQAVVEVARRSTRRDARAGSMVSVNSVLTRVSGTDAFSSQPETPGIGLRRGTSTSLTGTPAREVPIFTDSESGRTPVKKGKERLLMSRMLPHLFASADKLFTLLATTDPQQRDLVEQAALEDEFDMYRLRYVSNQSQPSINLKHVLSTLEVDPTSPAGSDACKIVTLANLVKIFDRIDVIQQDHSEDPLTDLQVCDDIIAQSMVVDEVENSAVLKPEDIMTQVVEIRTLLFMATLKDLEVQNQFPISRSEVLSDTFCQESPSMEAVEDFKQGNKDALLLKFVPGIDPNDDPWHKEEYITRLRSICEYLPNEAIDPATLQACLEQIKKFYDPQSSLRAIRESLEACFQEIKRQLQPVTPGPSYPATHYGAPDSSAVDSQIQSQLESESLAHTGQRQQPYMAALRAMKQDQESESGASQSQDGSYSTTQDLLDQGYGFASSSYASLGRASYPPNYDAQPSSSVVYPGHPGAIQNGVEYARSAAQLGRSKRASPGENGGVADGADAGKRPAKKPRTRRNKPTVPMPAAEGASGDAETPSSSAATAAAAVAAVARYSPFTDTQAEPDFEFVAQRTRELSAANRKAREPQQRSPWVRDDIRQLVKAVDMYKCKWSVIEKEIKEGKLPFVRPRDQQALRDKARLLKQDFLKVDAILPPSFDLVVLGKKERNAVIACGKNPDRKEADIANGIPINTEYRQNEQEQANAAEAGDQAHVQGEEQPEMQLEAQAEVQTEAQPEASAMVPAEAHVDAEAIEAASMS
ncbi:hypothetical protein SMAC4_05434 [Sordaria macrospora]|uniref:uncharacterized protein n=1 Tax=Sordaria macrospora TaxID=5147 RepID=UPI001D440A40|nr:hypothetical protein B0T09DRAFT_162385 [Sordaria sp. MPI-SDFR-AT-0083]WPJ57577.1 hypothetical protein SMAC4_05434 [Sordaria macrospora]